MHGHLYTPGRLILCSVLSPLSREFLDSMPISTVLNSPFSSASESVCVLQTFHILNAVVPRILCHKVDTSNFDSANNGDLLRPRVQLAVVQVLKPRDIFPKREVVSSRYHIRSTFSSSTNQVLYLPVQFWPPPARTQYTIAQTLGHTPPVSP